MTRRTMRLAAVMLVMLPVMAPPVATQSTGFRIVDAGPRGEVQQLQDANEIRVIFSEPMVALGRIPSNPTPAWIHIAPAIQGAYRWSGTTILIFTPDTATPLPFATRYTVTIDRAAESAAGHALGTSYQFTFTTPTVKLLSARWERQDGRSDHPVALALDFNQPVRAADILSHVAVRYEPHDWTAPDLSAEARARLQATDAAGLGRFDAKIAATRRAASATATVTMRVALNWNRDAFRPADSLVVLETVAPPPPESWLRVVVDARVPSPAGPAVPGTAQSSTAELDHAFFVEGPACQTECEPSLFNAIQLTAPVPTTAFAAALTIRDVTDPAHETTVAPTSPVKNGGRFDESDTPGVEDAGFGRQPAAHTWLLRLDGGLTTSDGQTLGYPWIGTVATWHDSAFASFGDGHGVWEKDGGPQLPFYARNLQSVTEWLSKVSPADLMPRILALEKSTFTDAPPGAGTIRRLGVTPDAVQSHGFDLSSALSPQGTGLFWTTVRDGDPIALSKRATPDAPTRSALVQVTNLGITVKDSPQSTLVFVTRLDNGQPVADATVTIISRANKALWTGRTKRDGVALAPALPVRQRPASSGGEDNVDHPDLTYLVTAAKDGDIAYVTSDWNEGIEPWDFGLEYGLWESTPVIRGSVFTDRGVYRPGEDIHVKAILRADTPTGMRLLPEGALLDVTTRDSRDREVDHRSLKVNRWSSIDWAWTVPAAGTVGNYSILVRQSPTSSSKTPGDADNAWLKEIRGSFLVAAYRRPDFRVDATVAMDAPVAGQPVHATLEARYLFGSAMSKRPVHWTLTREPESDVPAAITDLIAWKGFDFGYVPDERQARNTHAAGEDAALDANGRLTLDLPTDRSVDAGYRYTFEGDVEDVTHQHLANRADIVVYPAPWFIGLRQPDFFADQKKGTTADVAVVDRAGAPVSGVQVSLSLVRVQWNSVRHAEGHGFYSWQTERVETPAGQWTLTSGATPVTQAIPIPEGGFYELHAVAHDAGGHTTRTDSSFYGVGEGYTAWERFDHNRIKFEPERATWKPGETARLMVQSPWESATALLTIEREGVRQYRQFALTSTQQTVEVPVTEADIPNVYVSILLVRGRASKDIGADGDDPGKPAFRLGYAELKVEDATKHLAVTVSADRTEYRPTTAATVAVNVADSAGHPARTEVTLWAVDYGVLSLTGYHAPDVLSSVWIAKALQVATVDSRQRIISRRVLTPKGAADGGGGGNDGGSTNARRDFRPLAFWVGSIETDSRGHATTKITLPDSLTTYRIMAVADDVQSRFGSASTDIRVSKPVTLVPSFPRFLSVSDHATFGAVVTNTTAAGGSAIVTARSLDPAILEFDTGRETLTLTPGATDAVRFSAVAHAVGQARVEMTVTLGADSDSFVTTLPVSALRPIETTAAFGDTDGRTTQPVALPAGVAPDVGGLQIDVSSTALVGLGEGVRYLADYRFDCAEQKASRALGLLLASDLGRAFAMSASSPAEAKAQGLALLAELPSYQCAGGAFTFWPGDCQLANTYLTAYVLDVMKTAGGLGATPNDKVAADALDYLDAALKAPLPTSLPAQSLPGYGASLAYAVKVLSEYGRNQDSNLTRLYGLVDRLPIFSLSDLADALATSGDRGPRYQDVVRRLSNALRVEGDQAHAEEIDADTLAWLWDSNVRATAIVLDGFVRRGDDPVFVQRMVRWLLAARTNGRWANTQDNIMALRALVDYYKAFEATPPDMTVSVSLGAKTIGQAAFKGRSTVADSMRLSMRDLAALATGGAAPDLVVARTGTGHVYYTARLQAAPTDTPAAVDHGITVARRYEAFVENGEGAAATSFKAGDLVRVTLTVTVPHERRFVAVTDPLPAGFEAVEGWFRTTAADLAKEASTLIQGESPTAWQEWWRNGGFDHIEKYDDRVVVFGTRLGEGRHEFSYLVRATTSGTFAAAGAEAEEMYAPEVNGRAPSSVVVIR